MPHQKFCLGMGLKENKNIEITFESTCPHSI